MDLGGIGGILVASHLVGEQMRRVVDGPDHAAEEKALLPLYQALSVAPAAASMKAALKLLGHDVGPPRLPLVEPDADEVEVDPLGARIPGPAREGLTAT